jgi:hypothetical protein
MFPESSTVIEWKALGEGPFDRLTFYHLEAVEGEKGSPNISRSLDKVTEFPFGT